MVNQYDLLNRDIILGHSSSGGNDAHPVDDTDKHSPSFYHWSVKHIMLCTQ